MRPLSLLALWAICGSAYSQSRREVTYDRLASQVTVQYQHTNNNYFFQNTNGSLSSTNLNGAVVELSSRRFYPWEIVARASYSRGPVLSQYLQSYTAGVGYTRGFGRFQPFARITSGVARTHSSDEQYLYQPPAYGVTALGGAGLDVRVYEHWGVRAIEYDSQWVPYGTKSSIYRSFGSGIFFSFGR